MQTRRRVSYVESSHNWSGTPGLRNGVFQFVRRRKRWTVDTDARLIRLDQIRIESREMLYSCDIEIPIPIQHAVLAPNAVFFVIREQRHRCGKSAAGTEL